MSTTTLKFSTPVRVTVETAKDGSSVVTIVAIPNGSLEGDASKRGRSERKKLREKRKRSEKRKQRALDTARSGVESLSVSDKTDVTGEEQGGSSGAGRSVSAKRKQVPESPEDTRGVVEVRPSSLR